MRNYKDLKIYYKAHDLAKNIYELANEFPKHEQYNITSQIRRASLSIPTNIVEGSSRDSNKEFVHFLNIAIGSLSETEYLTFFSYDIGYISQSQFEKATSLITELRKMLIVIKSKSKNL